ncbi:MAG TPA: serine/threonine-protein kinase, partial [Polyangiaceae bacterium]
MTDLASATTSRATPVPASLPVVPGQIVGGRYRVGEVLGEGGMGVVLEAVHLGLEAPVALKIIRSDLMHDQEFVQRFVNEARAAALLKGEHIARVYDVGHLDTGEPYLVMERLEGVGLEAFLASEGPLDEATAVGFVLQVCEGLSEAHAMSLVHRDIKPANLFLSTRPDGRAIVKILDFGIAKRLADKQRRSLTNPARSLGSPWYMSPEQMMDPSRVDGRTDIWSLGVLLFELLTNDHPFDGNGVPEVCAKVLSARTPSVRDFRRGVDSKLDAVVRRCLEKDPDDRFPDVESLMESLLEFAPADATPSGGLVVPLSGRRRVSRSAFGSQGSYGERRARGRAWSTAFGVLGALAIAGAATWGVVTYGSGRDVRELAAHELERLERLERVKLPGDPVLGPDPSAAPLAGREVLVPVPVVAVPPAADEADEPEPTGAPSPSGAAATPLTPEELQR